MKSDTQLQKDVIDELRWDPRVRENEIAVAARDGVVTLSGTVESYAQKWAAERAAERVSGVRALAEELHVRVPGDKHRSDTDLAHAVANALSWDVEVPDDQVKVTVENGWVTLEGRVPWHFQRYAAERAVHHLTGVAGVLNHLVVAPMTSAAEVKGKIEAALKRSAEFDANRITVEATGGKVVLKGHVRSWAERRDAEHAAWAAPGVQAVQDELVIAI